MPSTGSTATSIEAIRNAYEVLYSALVTFIERKQELFCTVCRYRDPLVDGNKLHDDHCPLRALWSAIETATSADAVDPHAGSTGNLTTRDRSSS